MKVLVIDNYDSFVYNLVQYIGELGAETIVFRNDQVTLKQITKLKPDRIVISPGPGTPEDARYFGVCTADSAALKSRNSHFGSLPRSSGDNSCFRRKNRLCEKADAWKNLRN